MTTQQNSRPELLAPAGSMAALEAAVRCGADAVYLGGAQFSARAHAENFDANALRAAALFCHRSGVRVYPAVNTLLADAEFSALDELLLVLAEIGADGVIVQDLGVAAYIAKRVPTLPLHASTQMTIHSPAGIRYAHEAGFRRAVAARELSQTQLQAVCTEAARCGIEVEMFVHGAHCMSVSGQCWLSAAMGGRSANRGCCAQPCRLPFHAPGAPAEACALSLKDMSLTEHLQTLAEMGVQSLKIEGRMKRPEYVAAAVTACRRALDGLPADTETLKAVFSRSGFTDGYFTGRRRAMFGTRTREDVTAAQGVLGTLRQSYQSPRKCAVLHAHYILQPDTPATLTVSDDAGYSVTVTGDIPQIAQTRPTDLSALQRQFEKLGDTVYSPGTVTAELGEGLMLPASALNAMRRDAVVQMDRTRAEDLAPPHCPGEIPPLLNYPPQDAADAIRVQIHSIGQLEAVLPFADRLDALCLPLSLVPEYLRTGVPVARERCIVVPPRFVCDEEKIAQLLRSAHENGLRRLACQHVGDIALGKALHFTLHGSLGLHITNSRAAAVLAGDGLRDALLSPAMPQSARLHTALPLGRLIYGRLPLMLMRNCPVQAQVGCKGCQHKLIDRRGAALFNDCMRITEQPDYAELFNSAVLWLADRPAERRATFGLMLLTDETPARAQAVLAAYFDGKETVPPDPMTRGLHIADA